ncbi:MAG: glycoside hydrolase family 30 protein [Rubrivivax sp.]|nr:glycoside hydrolase family 30 protein [Rubrivivax sp.]
MRWWLTAHEGGECLAEQPPLLPAATPRSAPVRLWVDTTRRFQTLLGFGGAFTEAAATVWQRLPAAQQQALLQAYFSPTQGHGYTLCRVHMNSCDFSLGNYAHAEVPGDLALQHFSIARDRQALLPMIRAAQQVAGRPLQLLVSPWSPPAWMKSNGRMNDGGRLLPECRAAWAQCFVRFIQAYAEEGVPVWGVSVQNEPEAHQRWDSCLYTAEEERDFVRDHLGPALHAAGLGEVRIVVWDHNRDVMVERASVIYGDARAAQYVWGTGFHWYGEEHFDHVQLVHDAWPDKQLLFTEGCQEGGVHHSRWTLGERYARALINDLNRWTVGWIDWNLLLDEQGGPNHVGNLCSAPVLADAASGMLHHQASFWTLGHFARFIAPGAQRVLCASTRQALEATAFVHDDGRTAVVALNREDRPMDIELVLDGLRWEAQLPPHAIASFVGSGQGQGQDPVPRPDSVEA